MSWAPKILSEFEIGQAMTAIEAVARLGKPLAEVGLRNVEPSALELDLRDCLAMARDGQDVRIWIRPAGQYLRFGFYREPWVLRALDYLDDPELPITDRHWISGLLFGYTPSAIQDFISSCPGPDREAPTLSPIRSYDTTEAPRPPETAPALRS